MSLIQQLKEALDEFGWDESIDLKRNEYLSVMGTRNTQLYYVLEGSLRAFIQDEQTEHTIRLAYRDNFFNSMDSFISEQPSAMYLQALKKCKLLALSKSRFQQFIDLSDKHRELWTKSMEMLIYSQLEREMDILTASPLERYKRVLSRSPQVFQEIPHKYIASYLRMTPETLSRLKKTENLDFDQG